MPYTLKVGDESLNLTAGRSFSGRSLLKSYGLAIDIESGALSGVRAGTYSDTLTFEISARL